MIMSSFNAFSLAKLSPFNFTKLPSSYQEYKKVRDEKKNYFTKEWIQDIKRSIQEERSVLERLKKEKEDYIKSVNLSRLNFIKKWRQEKEKAVLTQTQFLYTPHYYQHFIDYRDERKDEDESEEESSEDEDEIARLPTLPNEVVAVIEECFSKRRDDLIVEENGIEIRVKDLETLKGNNWLNDEIINFYFQLIQRRSIANKEQTNVKVYCFNTFFYKRLKEGGHKVLKRWTKKVDLFSLDLILIPVHLEVHWTLASISIENCTINYYDSMNGNNRECLQLLLEYLRDERKDKKGDILDTSKWTCNIVKEIPQQENGSDCGVFTCKYAERLSIKKPFNFSQVI